MSSKRSVRKTSGNRGFTLIELIIVVVLLALVAGVALPVLLNRGDSGERKVMRQLAGTVKQLYNEATLTRDQHQLTFDLDRNSMTAFRLRKRGGVTEKQQYGKERSLQPFQLQQVEIAGKGSFTHGKVSVSIFPLGWMEQTRILLAADKGRIRQLDFSPLTGSTKIADERTQL